MSPAVQLRRARTTRRIPAELWSLAAELGIECGLRRTARVLRVDYYGLKKQIDGSSSDPEEAEAAPVFVEILTAPGSDQSGCQMKFEAASGRRIRIQMQGARTPVLAKLSRLFWAVWPEMCGTSGLVHRS